MVFINIRQILSSKVDPDIFVLFEPHNVHPGCGKVLDQAQGNDTNQTERQASAMKRIGRINSCTCVLKKKKSKMTKMTKLAKNAN